MRVIISLPLPFDVWSVYEPHIIKFCETFRRYPPGHDYELWSMCNWGEPTDEIRSWFYGIKTRFVFYNENGCDIGGHQTIANQQRQCFIVGMTSRCYFHRANWLGLMMAARENYGPGLYGCSASGQGGRLHLCTRAFGLDSDIWRRYPYEIDSRTKGPMFEVGDERKNIMEFVNTKAKTFVVHWDNVFQIPDEVEKYFASPGRFRDGHQNAMLVHDYHTDLYSNASEENKSKMVREMCQLPANSA